MVIQSERPFQGTARDCAVATFGEVASTTEVGRLERRVEWNQDGYSGYVIDVTLRSGLELCVFNARAERFVSLRVESAPTDLMISLSRGTGLSVAVDDGPSRPTGGGTLEITHIKRPVVLTSSVSAGAHNEFIVLTLKPETMCALLGASQLPATVQKVVASEDAYCREAVPMGAELFRLLDEMLACQSVGLSRQLYLEGKGLELLARIFDELSTEESRPPLSPKDVERLVTVRETLISRMDAPPALRELSRQVGLNQTKLKEGFRTLFGVPIYSYLRDRRMSEAYRLLRERNLNVTEVATHVGYANPSKFASAFRKHFGISPSSVGRVA